MYRKALEVLKKWKGKPDKKALLVTGARQIGKTYLIRKFAKEEYEHFAEINFITRPTAEKIFSGDLNADTIIMNLTAFLGMSLEPGKTLIFLMKFRNVPMLELQLSFWLKTDVLII